jgi:hypothetical protein
MLSQMAIDPKAYNNACVVVDHLAGHWYDLDEVRAQLASRWSELYVLNYWVWSSQEDE